MKKIVEMHKNRMCQQHTKPVRVFSCQWHHQNGEKKQNKNMFLVVAPLVRESPCDTLTGVYIRTRVYVGGRQTNKCAVC